MMTSVAEVTEIGLPLLYVNLVGGHDDVVFDGASLRLIRGKSVLIFRHSAKPSP